MDTGYMCMGGHSHRKTFGLLLNTFASQYSMGIWRGVKGFLTQQGIGVKCFVSSTVVPSHSIYYTNVVLDMIRSAPLDGLLVISNILMGDFKLQHYKEEDRVGSYFGLLAPMPVVCIGRPVEGIPSIVVDNRSGIRSILDHMVSLNRKKIAFIQGTPGGYDADERFAAYREYLLENSLPYDENLVVCGHFDDKNSGHNAVNTLLKRPNASFDAILAANDEIALSTCHALRQLGFKVPEEILVGGFDNSEQRKQSGELFPTIDLPMEEMGRLGSEMLLRFASGEKVPPRTVLSAPLIEGGAYSLKNRRIDGISAEMKVRERMRIQNRIIKSLYPVTGFDELGAFLKKGTCGHELTCCQYLLFSESGEGTVVEGPSLIHGKNGEAGVEVLAPFYNEGSSYGLVLIRASGIEMDFYELLAIQIGSVINRILLFSRTQKYTERLEKEVALRTAELEEAHREKTMFFINLAHETKTPLTLIKNYMEKYIEEAGVNEDLRIIKKNIDILLRNMVNFLDAEKLKRGQIFYDHDNLLNFSELIENKIQLFREIAVKKEIKIHSRITPDLYIQSDPFAADRIINNLMDNAIKYTDSGGDITLSLEKNGFFINLTVSDSGIGMSSDQLEKIFHPYHQLSGKKRNVQGIGMGLYIVKKILDSLGADLQVRSRVGEGSVFALSFPCPEEVEKEVVQAMVSVPLDGMPVIKKPMDFGTGQEKAPVALGAATKATILIVDDNPEMLYFLYNFLKDCYNIYTAENGVQALGKLQTIEKTDLIISDIMMDEMDGYEFLSRIKRITWLADIPFIFLTAKSTTPDRIQGLREGAVDYIFKPFLIEELKAKIEAFLLNRENMERNLFRSIRKKMADIFQAMEVPGGIEKERPGLPEKFFLDYRITRRERDVLEHVLEGYYNKEISSRIGVSLKTVEFHLYNIYQKLKVQNKVELSNFVKEYMVCIR